MPGRLTSSHLIGRIAELAELADALAHAAAGRPGLVLLAGDSGIGKTRLIAEFVRRAAAASQPLVLLRGEAVPTGDGELPFGPLLGALRPLVRSHDAALSDLSSGGRAVLGALVPGLEAPGTRRDPGDPSSQVRLFEAVLELLDRLGARAPVVLVIEDAHWADSSTRAFLAFLARSVREERLLVVVSYRSDELHRRHPLRPLITELERADGARRLRLAPFDAAELAQALTDILGQAPDAALRDRLLARAEGNPLFTEELLAAGLDGRGPAPESLQDAFLLRIERLSDGAQRAARAVAVATAADEALIAAMTGSADAPLQAVLREAVAAQVLVPGADGALHFRHELLREVLYDDLLPGERVGLHLAAARALESRAGAEEPAGDVRAECSADVAAASAIAAHYAAAGAQPQALRANVRAALAARCVHAAGDAARLAERALELWPQVPDAVAVAGRTRIELTLLAADAVMDAGGYARGEALVSAALETLEPDGDPLVRAAVLDRLARAQWQLNRGPTAVATATEALRLLPADAARERADIAEWLARRKLLRGRFREAVAEGETALAAAVALEDPATEARALQTIGMAEIASNQVESGTARLRRAIDLCEADDDREGASYGYANLADLLAIAGRTSEALATARRGLAATPRALRGNYDWLVMTVSELAFLSGDWALARSHIGPSPRELLGLRLIYRLLREAELGLGEGDETAAARALAEAAPLVAGALEPQWIGADGALRGELHRRRHEFDDARAAIAAALDRIELCTDDVSRISRVAATGLRVEADSAQRARDVRDHAGERAALVEARRHAGRLRAAAAAGGRVERAWLATGTAELARARGSGEVRLWERAAAAWTDVGRPYETALMQWRAAEAALAAGDRATACTHGCAALAGAQALGSRWLSEELRGLARRGRTSFEPAASAPDLSATAAGAAAEREDPFGLTARERDVLVLVAAGATNREIGQTLFMAEKTASVHVSRILAKLGVRSRTEAAAVAHRIGWATAGLAASSPR